MFLDTVPDCAGKHEDEELPFVNIVKVLVGNQVIGGALKMADINLTLVQKLYLEALKDGSKDSSQLISIVKDKLTELKGGNNPVGATARSQAVLDELTKNGYIVVVSKKLFGAKTYDITGKGRDAIS